jgi:hypothetical protein
LNTVIIPNVSLIFDWRLWSNSRTSRNKASLSLVFYVSATDLVEVSMPGKPEKMRQILQEDVLAGVNNLANIK